MKREPLPQGHSRQEQGSCGLDPPSLAASPVRSSRTQPQALVASSGWVGLFTLMLSLLLAGSHHLGKCNSHEWWRVKMHCMVLYSFPTLPWVLSFCSDKWDWHLLWKEKSSAEKYVSNVFWIIESLYFFSSSSEQFIRKIWTDKIFHSSLQCLTF